MRAIVAEARFSIFYGFHCSPRKGLEWSSKTQAAEKHSSSSLKIIINIVRNAHQILL